LRPTHIFEEKNNMKKILVPVFALCCTAALWGQAAHKLNSGKITFVETVKLNFKIEGDAPQFDLPKERKSEKILTFNEEATLFEEGNNNINEEMESENGDGNGNVRIRIMGSGENKTYTDLKNKTVTDQRDFMNRIFLVEKKSSDQAWKVTGQQKVILGYNCFEATSQDTAGIKTVAWFTPDINISSGPAGLGNLPGMILEADINSGSRVYTAKTIDPSSVKIQKPKDGKKVTEPEFKAIMAEKMKEMGVEEAGGGNQVRVIIRHQ
jgi:GLPGLI family protein